MESTTHTSIKLDRGTTIRVLVQRREENPYQMDAFADYKENWARECLAVALKMPSRFYFSELRMMLAHEPPNPNWFGSVLIQRMKKAGFRMTGNFRRHTRESRNGGCDFEWSRVAS